MSSSVLPILAAVFGSLGSSTSQISNSGSFDKLLEHIKVNNKINRFMRKNPSLSTRFGKL